MEYGERKDLASAMMRVFEVVIRELDEAYLQWQRDQRKEKTKK